MVLQSSFTQEPRRLDRMSVQFGIGPGLAGVDLDDREFVRLALQTMGARAGGMAKRSHPRAGLRPRGREPERSTDVSVVQLGVDDGIATITPRLNDPQRSRSVLAGPPWRSAERYR